MLIWFSTKLKVTFAVHQEITWDQDMNLINISIILGFIHDNETLCQNENQSNQDNHV